MVYKVLSKDKSLEVEGTTRENFDALISTKEIFYREGLFISLQDYDFIINCIGVLPRYIIDLKDIEKAIRVNAVFPYILAQTGKNIIQIATDCAGEPTIYGQTKKLGEVDTSNFMNIRCSIIGPEVKTHKNLLDWFLGQSKNAEVKGYIDHLWNGVTTLAFAKYCKQIIKKDEFYCLTENFTPADYVSKYQLLLYFQKYFRPDIKVKPVCTGKIVNRIIPEEPNCENDVNWEIAGYEKVPTIEKLVKELTNYMERKK